MNVIRVVIKIKQKPIEDGHKFNPLNGYIVNSYQSNKKSMVEYTERGGYLDLDIVGGGSLSVEKRGRRERQKRNKIKGRMGERENTEWI